jgi:uncharacterized protein YjbJ (UPF0337 family)
MKLGGRKVHVRKMGHRALHKVSVGSRRIQQGSQIGGKILKKVGRATGQEELVMAGEGLQEAGRVAGKVGRVSRSLEKVV